MLEGNAVGPLNNIPYLVNLIFTRPPWEKSLGLFLDCSSFSYLFAPECPVVVIAVASAWSLVSVLSFWVVGLVGGGGGGHLFANF